MKTTENNTIFNEFVPYEVALAMKELGFNEPCFAIYQNGGKITYAKLKSYDIGCFAVDKLGVCNSPLYQQAFKWFREKYHIISYPIFKGGKTIKTSWYDYIIYSEINWENNNPNQQWKTYEEAELACLNKLIEIIKTK